MNRLFKISIYLLLILAANNVVFASHIRAADITAESIDGSNTRYKFILSVYSDFDNVADNPISINPNDLSIAEVSIGSGSSVTDVLEVKRTELTEIVEGVTFENIFEFEYQFRTAGNFRISFVGNKRNENVENIPNSSTVDLYVETFIRIDNFASNITPKFTFPPITIAASNRTYTYNPGAYDEDGDSISFELIESSGVGGLGVDIGYLFPDDPTFGTPSVFKIDPFTGLITWDTPLLVGEYNFAFRVDEYRNGVRIGYVIRDMQILVIESDNNPPLLEVPEDACIGVNTNYSEIIRASDPDGDFIVLELSGGFVEEGGELGNFQRISDNSVVGNADWTPTCSAVSKNPIIAIASVNDIHPQGNLYTVDDWSILVFGDQVQNLTATSNKSEVSLNWDKYECDLPNGSIKIYRTSCDTSLINRMACVGGVPEEWGFQEIGEVATDQTSFLDDGSVISLTNAVQYYYIVSVEFGTPGFGLSYASDVASVSLPLETAIITQVSFDKDQEDKFVNVAWDHFELPQGTHQAPYEYTIQSDGQILFETVVDGLIKGNAVLDTTTFDTKKELSLIITDGLDNQVGVASIVIAENLTTLGFNNTLDLTWTNNNQWHYADSLYQKIYSFKAGEDTLLVDSIKGGEINYTISDLKNNDTVCTYVELQYVFCFDGIDSVFTGFTNTSCSLIKDTIAPCPPDLSIELIDCSDSIIIGNQLSWDYNDTLVCNQDLLKFEIEKQDLIEEGSFLLFGEVTILDFFEFDDEEGLQLSCYRVVAVDSSGNRSEPSNIVCQDFCGGIELPNIFTPNGDGTNDYMVSNSSFRGYTDLIFQVFNRWGKEVYKETDFETLSWDGISANGEKLSDGTYFVYITGQTRVGDKSRVEYKGWLVLSR